MCQPLQSTKTDDRPYSQESVVQFYFPRDMKREEKLAGEWETQAIDYLGC